jgi:hypothetical protein
MASPQRDERPVVRSYQPAFRFETMIYRLGTDLTLPRPVPARVFLYGLAIWPALFILYQLPVLSTVTAHMTFLVKSIGIPATFTWLLAAAEVQGRRFHVALQAWVRHWISAKHLAGGYRPVKRPDGHWRPPDIVFISDGRCGTPPDGIRLQGPGRVALCYPCEAHQKDAVLTLRQVSLTPLAAPKLLSIADRATVRLSRGAGR